MRISDWSADVCSSDLPPTQRQSGAIGAATATQASEGGAGSGAASKKGKRTIYLPPGFMKARLLTGIDALASRDATSNPEPIIARVQAPAVLPNEVKANLAGRSEEQTSELQSLMSISTAVFCMKKKT